MLTFFCVSHSTDGKTTCRIHVEPQLKEASVVVTVDRIIVRQGDQTDATFRSILPAQWTDVSYWESKARDIAKAYSPFWRGESAA
jgi:hypothetical protein